MKRHWPIFLLFFLTFAYFFPVLISGKRFLYGDNFSHQIPTLSFWKQQVLKGEFPLWNPYILGGVPFLADLSHNSLAPTNIFYLLIPIPVTLTILAITFLGAASIFTYLFLRAITKKTLPSLFSAVVFTFSGTLIASINDINSLQGIAYIPIVFFTAHHWVSKRDLSNSILLVAVISLQFFSSHPQYSYYTWVSVAFYLLVMMKRSLKERIVTTILIFITFAFLSAIQLLPFLEFSQLAYRPQTAEFPTQNQFKLIELPRLVFANFYGSWKDGSSWGPGAQLETGLANTEGYIGLLPLILAIHIAVTGKGKQIRFWSAVAALPFLLSLGSQTPLSNLARFLLPFYSKFRSPIRILSFYSFAMAVLAGISLARFERSEKS